MKKNVYSFQVNFLHGNTTFLPYAMGTLIACAKNIDEIDEEFEFREIFILRENTDSVLEKIENPSVVAFSNYIWNFEYNKVMAKKIKNKYPECVIIFGGHQIGEENNLLEKEKYIDILIYGEGEETFAGVLLALKNKTPLSSVDNIALREGEKIVVTDRSYSQNSDYPSPYLTGVFDSIFEHYPSLRFHAILETNRGCPYGCAYCDWGNGNLKCRIRMFPEEKIMAELNWFSDHGISGFGFADANFGMFERDERFVDEMIRLHYEKGVLSDFQTSYAKNSNERVFSITKKLNDCGMNKGATISFQSMDSATLENIHRKNIPVTLFSELMDKYNEAGIATYSELILGLPGETPESLVRGIDDLLDAGQHNAIYIHNCEWLPCSPMGEGDYTKEHGIETVRIPLNQPHRIIENDEVTEYSNIVVATNSMSREDWVKMNIYSCTVQCFHHQGLLMLFALCLHNEKNLKYSDFYNAFIEYASAGKDSLCGELFCRMKERFTAVSEGEDSLVFTDERFGNVLWPAEEYMFLNCVFDYERFCAEIKPFLASFFDDGEFFEELFSYQQNVLKRPFAEKREFTSSYDFNRYFRDLICGRKSAAVKENCHYIIRNPIRENNWPDYARYVVWYGRKDSRNIYLNEIEKE